LNGGDLQQSGDICRDYLRNVCRRGDRCKFTHPAQTDQAATNEAKLQDKIEFCHDFQNGKCDRYACKFLHTNADVEREFKNSGYLPPSVRDQVLNKGIAVDFPATTGGVPICKDFLKGTCFRQDRCKFRHVNHMEYDIEMSFYTENRRRPISFSGGLGFFEDSSNLFERRQGGGTTLGYSQERKRRCLPVSGSGSGPDPEGGGPGREGQGTQQAGTGRFLQEENQQLRMQIAELEKKVSDLTATNEFLLDQNAQLRMGVKSGGVGVGHSHSHTAVQSQGGVQAQVGAVPVQAVQQVSIHSHQGSQGGPVPSHQQQTLSVLQGSQGGPVPSHQQQTLSVQSHQQLPTMF